MTTRSTASLKGRLLLLRSRGWRQRTWRRHRPPFNGQGWEPTVFWAPFDGAGPAAGCNAAALNLMSACGAASFRHQLERTWTRMNLQWRQGTEFVRKKGPRPVEVILLSVDKGISNECPRPFMIQHINPPKIYTLATF